LPRLCDLVPVRPAPALILILAGITLVSLIETVHIYARTTPTGSAASQLASLDVAVRGSVAAWFSTATLTLAALGAVVIYLVRRHRVDDYRGRYRVWLWVAGALAWASLDAATGIHDAVGLGIAILAGTPLDSLSLASACTMSWLVIYALLFGALAIRAALEIWPSMPAFSAVCVATLCYFLGGLAELEILSSESPLVASVIGSSLVMLAHVAVASSVLLYARHVHLDAQGRLKVHIDPSKRKKAKPKSKARLKVVKEDKDDAAAKSADKSIAASKSSQPAATGTSPRFGAASGGSSNQPAKASATVTKATSSSYEDDDEDEDDGDDRVSKAERRRLKKMARREQGRRAA